MAAEGEFFETCVPPASFPEPAEEAPPCVDHVATLRTRAAAAETAGRRLQMHQQEAAGAYCLDCVTPTTTAHQTGLGTDTWTTYLSLIHI